MAAIMLTNCAPLSTGITVIGNVRASAVIELTTEKVNLDGVLLEKAVDAQLQGRSLNERAAGSWTRTDIHRGSQVGYRFQTAKKETCAGIQYAFSQFGLPITISKTADDNFRFALAKAGLALDENFLTSTLTVTMPGKFLTTTGGESQVRMVTLDLTSDDDACLVASKPSPLVRNLIIFGGTLIAAATAHFSHAKPTSFTGSELWLKVMPCTQSLVR